MPLLNYQFHPLTNNTTHHTPTLIFIHGLFGDMNNLGIIAKAFAEQYPLLRVDLRNHGESFHSDEMNYDLMADDLLAVIHALHLSEVILIGHSMGGKTAMAFSAKYPSYVKKLIVIDIAPVVYTHNEHLTIFKALNAIQEAKLENRQQAKQEMSKFVVNEAVRQFILKSFDAKRDTLFRFNVKALQQNYQNIMGWHTVYCETPTLFIRGGKSDYILPEYKDTILAQFPNATSFTIGSAAHWVHAERPDLVEQAIRKFI